VKSVAVVVIGRNEARHLAACLASVRVPGRLVVYADSGSTDGSAELAEREGVEVVRLDPSRRFSAARGRNEGLRRALAMDPGVRYVQFIDGDCELTAGWLERATHAMHASDDTAIVTGHLHEKLPGASIYNRLGEMEWRGLVGEIAWCGGIFLARVAVLQGVGGFNEDVGAGEEPELCLRLRRAGLKVVRIDTDMATHDSDMRRFSQWWWRSVRTGRGYAQSGALHGEGDERLGVKESRSALFWGLLLPGIAVLLAWPTFGVSLAVLALIYAAQVVRVYRHAIRRETPRRAFLYAVFCVLGKIPQAVGQLQFRFTQPKPRHAPAAPIAAPSPSTNPVT
jgi:GT2 family glycosyltransferase